MTGLAGYINLGILEFQCGFPGGSDGKESACNIRDLGSIPGSVRSPGEGNGYPLQYSYLENSIDRGGWQATVHGLQRVRHDRSNSHSFKLLRLVEVIKGVGEDGEEGSVQIFGMLKDLELWFSTQ